MAGAYSMSSLLEMKDAVGSCSTLFMSNLSMYASLGNSLELKVSHHLRGRRSGPQPLSVILLQTRLRYHAFDVVVSLTFGKKLGFFDRGKDMDAMMEAIQGKLVYASQSARSLTCIRSYLATLSFAFFCPQWRPGT